VGKKPIRRSRLNGKAGVFNTDAVPDNKTCHIWIDAVLSAVLVITVACGE